MPVRFFDRDGKEIGEIAAGGIESKKLHFLLPAAFLRVEVAEATQEELVVCCKILGRQIPPEAATYAGSWVEPGSAGRWFFVGNDARLIAANWENMVPEYKDAI